MFKNKLNLLVASNNKKKIQELKQILKPHQIIVLTSDDIGGIPEVEETGKSFEENAALKATEIAKLTGNYVFADDSGLEVEALNNAPGIYSARYAGKNASDSDRINKLLNEMDNCCNRKARFVCVIAISDKTGTAKTFRGEVYGKILHNPQGNSGFGYDPVFVPDGYQKTFAELPPEVKNKISHRANALKKALDELINVAESRI
ncbi:MAG: XTP/dITP diphosphatase [Victivallales bacterium]|nr:XTP/dITP diphosphatase [Victivallales bacterium]MCF7888552.1 XTP/dITP diphosphatase [Victivallales bacterium]